MHKRIPVLCVALLLLLCSCGPKEEVPVDTQEPDPTVEPSEVADGEPYINEWGQWVYGDIDIRVAPKVYINDEGVLVAETADGITIPTKEIKVAASALKKVTVDNVLNWWGDETRICKYGLNTAEDVAEALAELGLTIETCPINSVSKGDGFTCSVTGTEDANYQIVVLFT